MSNKFRYYTVSVEATVKAKNKSEALALLLGSATTEGEVLSQDNFIDRITAVEAREQIGWGSALSA